MSGPVISTLKHTTKPTHDFIVLVNPCDNKHSGMIFIAIMPNVVTWSLHFKPDGNNKAAF